MRLRLYTCAALMGLGLPQTAYAWEASLATPPGGAFLPTAPLRIDLPKNVDLAELTMLGVELDGVDITSMLSLDGNDFTYTPVEPLAPGRHQIRLVAMNPDGTMTPKQSWDFVIGGNQVSETGTAPATPASMTEQQQIAAAESWLRGGSFQADTLTEFSHRSFDKNVSSGNERAIVSGAGNLHADMHEGNWEVRTRTNYLAQSENNLALTDNALDIGEYEMTANYADNDVQGGVTLGHHNIGVESYLLSNFYRRGASARLGAADGRARGAVFAFKPESVTGIEDFTGLGESDNRLEGATVSLKPFSADAGSMEITTLYYDGEGNDAGTGLSGTNGVAKGSGWGMVVSQGLMDGRLALRGEYAQSDYDIDGGALSAPEDTSGAYSIAMEARPFSNLSFDDKPADLVTGVRYERLDTFFNSLANPGMAADRNAITAYSNMYWDKLSAGLQLVSESNNVDDLATAPRDRMQQLQMNASYSFDPQEGDMAWLGTPYLMMSGFVSDMNRIHTPLSYTGPDTDNVSRSLMLGGGSSYSDWYWSLTHTLAQFEDKANVASDTMSNITGLFGGYTVSENLEVHGGVQGGSFHDRANSPDTSFDTTLNFGASGNIIPNVLRASADYNLNLSSGSTGSPDRQMATSEVEWTLIKPETNKPGVALALRGSIEDNHGGVTQDETAYQVFTVLRVRAPMLFGF